MLEQLASQLSWINQIVSLVWMLLTGIMLALLWLSYRQRGPRSRSFCAMALLIATVFAYPIYTFGFQWATVGLIGNIVTILATSYAIYQLRRDSIPGAWLLSFQNAWLVIATVCLFAELMLEQRAMLT